MECKEMTAPCGLNCSICELYNYKKKLNPRRIKYLYFLGLPIIKFLGFFSDSLKLKSKMLDRLFLIPKEKPLCRGCRKEKGNIAILENNKTCRVYKCTKRKGIHNCSECGIFPCNLLYPSNILSDVLPHNIKVINCCLIDKHGLGYWYYKLSEDILEQYYNGDIPLEI